MDWNERRKRLWACPFFGLTDEYKVLLHELIYDLASIGHLGYDAVYTMPVHYRTFYIRKVNNDKQKEKDKHESAMRMQNEAASSTSKVARGPAIERR